MLSLHSIQSSVYTIQSSSTRPQAPDVVSVASVVPHPRVRDPGTHLRLGSRGMEWQLTIFRQFKTAPGPGTTARTPEVDPSYKSGHCHHTLLGRWTLIRQHARYHDKYKLLIQS